MLKKIILAGHMLLTVSSLVAMESKPNLVLDLDDVILHKPSQKITEEHEFFSQRSFLVQDSYGYNYIVPAYLSEFLKFATTRFNIAFFSSGDGQRNRSVVEDMWQKVLEISKPENIQVLSRNDLTFAENIWKLQPFTLEIWEQLPFDEADEKILEQQKELTQKGGDYPWYGVKKKDISKLGELHNTILVDDGTSWVLNGQVSNLLKVTIEGFDKLRFCHVDYDDKADYSQKVRQYLLGADRVRDAVKLLAFYKLAYIAGVLDAASGHGVSIVQGLYDIQFKDDKPVYDDTIRDLTYYKRGYKVLSEFADGGLKQHFPEIEKYFQG